MSSYGCPTYCGPLSLTISSGGPNMLNHCADLLAIVELVVVRVHLLDKIKLGVIIGKKQIIAPFDLEHIAGHLGPRCGWHIVSEERLLTMLRLALLADCTAFHHHLCLYRCLASTQTHA